MQENLNAIWWITAVELPVLSSLFWLIFRFKQEAEKSLNDFREDMDGALTGVREDIATHKIDVATSYVPAATLREVEQRLTDHLLRLEARLEARLDLRLYEPRRSLYGHEN